MVSNELYRLTVQVDVQITGNNRRGPVSRIPIVVLFAAVL